MKRSTSRPLVRQPRGLQPAPTAPKSPFKSHLPIPAQRHRMENAGIGKRVAAALAGALFIGCVISYFAYRANRSVSGSLEAAKKTAQTFAVDLAARDYWGAAKQLSPSAQRLHPPNAIRQEIKLVEIRDGHVAGAEIADATPHTVAGLQTCSIHYYLICERGRVPLRLTLVRSYRRWSVESYTFD